MNREILFYMYIADGGDGEYHPQFFESESDCQKAYAEEVESYGYAAGPPEPVYASQIRRAST